jgi:hypothetical protein
MPNDDVSSAGPIPLTGRTWARIHTFSVIAAWTMENTPNLRNYLLEIVLDGLDGLLTALEDGRLCLRCAVIEDGQIAFDVGAYDDNGEPAWWSRATDVLLQLNPEERAWAFARAEQTGQVFAEVPDPDSFGGEQS